MRISRSLAFQFAAVVGLAAGLLLGCGSEDEEATPDVEPSAGPAPVFHATDNPETLSEWGQLASNDGQLALGDGVTPYTLNSALFSDYARKLRTVWLPEGRAPATYDPEESFDFPVGTVITKTFYYELADRTSPDRTHVAKSATSTSDVATPIDLSNVRLIETRILARRESGWVALPYIWDAQQSTATLQRAGAIVDLTLVDGETETAFPYVVPNANQCAGCHATNHTTKQILPIGPKARHLNTMVSLADEATPQLELWQDLGLVQDVPDTSAVPTAAVWDDDAASLDDRARSYLDINCSHCHNRNGPADTSGLFLELSTEFGARLGVCKAPVAAGTGTGNRLVGIHPGEPDESIFVFRMESSDPGAMMPELGRSLIHREGVDLIADWIDSLDGECA